MKHTADSIETLEECDLTGEFLVEFQPVSKMNKAHWHDHIEINYLSSGTLLYLFNGQRIRLGPGTTYCFWARMPHQVVRFEEPAELTCAYVPFPAFLALSVPNEIKSSILSGVMMSSRNSSAFDTSLFDRWATEWETASDPEFLQILREELLLFVRRFSLNCVPAELEGPFEDELTNNVHAPRFKVEDRTLARVQSMIDFINQNFAESIQVPEITAASGLHQTNAMAAFKKVVGMTIAGYLRRRRLSNAMMSLANSDQPIVEIAYECGYGSLSRFYQAFRTQLNTTPREYRMQFRD